MLVKCQNENCDNHFEARGVKAWCGDKCRRDSRSHGYRQSRQRRLFLDNYTCTEQGCTESESLQTHHRHPVCLGGSHDVENLQTLCPVHHQAKHSKGWLKRAIEEILRNEYTGCEVTNYAVV
jgi:5-methylcytosine-specific restriction endonuclease McrA